MIDRIIKVQRSFLNVIRGFLNVFAQQCNCCMRAKPISCVGCMYGRAKDLMRQLDAVRDAEEEKYYIDNPMIARQKRIVRAIEQADRPLLSKEIKIPDVSRGLKKWTLKIMCERNILGSFVGEDGHYRFYIKHGMPKTPRFDANNNRKTKKQGE